jgi:hypothetical protein
MNTSKHTLNSRTHMNLLQRPSEDLCAPPAIFRWFTSIWEDPHQYSDDAQPGKQKKTPKCLFSTTQARGRKQGGLNGYHQCQRMLNTKLWALIVEDL